MDNSEKNVYKFDYYHWGKVVHDIKVANDLKIKRHEHIKNLLQVREIATKISQKSIKDAIRISIETNNYDDFPDDISNSNISNDSKEIHIDNNNCCCPFFRRYFFRKNYNIA